MKTDDQAKLLAHLHRSEEAIRNAVSGVDEETWMRKPADDRWSIGECAEHISIVERRIVVRVKQFSEVPAEPYEESDSNRKDEAVLGAEFRGERRQAPEMALPKSEYPSPSEFLIAYRDIRAQSNALAQEFPEWLRGRFFEHPFFKKLDGYQWLTAMSAHGLRHAAQIEEIRQELPRA